MIDQKRERKILNWWKFTWFRAGWNPVVLSINEAKSHPRWEWYSNEINNKPMMNSTEYESACFHRWMAVAAIGGGIQSDYDCMNNGLRSEHLTDEIKDGSLTIYEPAHVPSLVSGSKEEFDRMCELFAGFRVSDYKPEMMAESMNGTRVSDMFILANHTDRFKTKKIVWEFHREPGWQSAKAIHFSNWSCDGIGKENAIPAWLQQNQ